MTEETNEQVQPTQSTQSAQPVQEEMVTIYASTNAVPFAAMLIPKEWADIGNTYPMTTIQPDPSLKSPKMDWNTMKWFENDTAQQGKDIDQLISLVKMTNAKLGKLQANSANPTNPTNPTNSTNTANTANPAGAANPANTTNATSTVTSTTKGGNE